MAIEYGTKSGALQWIRNPFSGTVLYFNEIHRKPQSFRHLTNPQNTTGRTYPLALSPEAFQAEATYVRQACAFCPGNETKTMQELRQVQYRNLYTANAIPEGCQPNDWAMRVIHNIVPRIPEECTGGRNESYVMIEDARHFLPDATHLNDLMWAGALPAAHYARILELAVEVVQYSTENPAVKSVLIRKHQGRESGASQPHIHIQIIGADRIFPDIEREINATAAQPDIWQESVDFMQTFGFNLEAGDGIVSQWSPFGKFPRHFEIISMPDRKPLPAIPPKRLQLFAQYAHRLLRVLGPEPYDMEIHHGEGIPLHMHVHARRFVYANIGGTLNSPSDLAENILPPTRDMIQRLARQVTNSS